MPLPTNWPPRVASGVRSIRYYKTAAATANFPDNAYLFIDGVGANPYTSLPVVSGGNTALPLTPTGTGVSSDGTAAMIWAGTIRVTAVGGDIEFSFDGTNVHGKVLSGNSAVYRNRYEAGIALRGAGTFIVEAW